MQISDGELIVLVGPSGCGKTTALRMVAGLEEISDGCVRIGDRIINELEPRDRDIAMVFQSYALYPHMSVYDNMAFPLRLMGMPKGERDAKIRAVARTLGLEPHLRRRPRQLSGGQRQRVAMGRAIVREPQVFLMDEPLSNLDAKLRVQMRAEIASLQRDLRVTTIYVTHDQVEAMTIGDRVAVMRRGRLQQIDFPQRLYDRPSNLFVAGFIGSPSMNFVEARLEKNGAYPSVAMGAQSMALDEQELGECRGLAEHVGQKVVVGVRPEALSEVHGDRPKADRVLVGHVSLRESLGADALIHFVVDGSPAISGEVRELAHDIEDPAELEELERAQGGVTFIGRLDPRTETEKNMEIRVEVRAGALQLFDPRSGQSLRNHAEG